MDVDLEELARLLEMATPGDWIAQSTDTEGPDYGVCIVAENLGGLVAAALPWSTEIAEGDFTRVEANAALIVALHNAAPSLIAEVEALRGEVARLREASMDAHDALVSAKAFILKKHGSQNTARNEAIEKLRAILGDPARAALGEDGK